MDFIEKLKRDQELLKSYLEGKITKEELEEKGVKIKMPI